MTNSPVSHDPHPLLKAALGTLDMTVESEMSLFRQHQALTELPSEIEEQGDEPQFLPEATASPVDPPEELISSEPGNQEPIPTLELDDVAEDLTPSELALFQVKTDAPEESDTSEPKLDQQEAVLEPSPRFKRSTDVAGAPLSSEATESDTHLSKLDPAIEDYLDSSTALRQHLEDAVTEPETPPEATSFTPKRIMMLIGGSIVGAFVVVLLLNVTGLRNKLWPPKPSQPSSQNPVATPNASTAAPKQSPATALTPPSPDLSSSDTNDSLSRLEPSVSPAPSPTANQSPVPTPANGTSAPAQEPVPILENQTSQTGLFYVVIPYNNAASLQQTRKLVPTAFLTNGIGGQQVQAGALETMEAAQRLAKQLRSNGLSAAIITP